MTTAYSGHRRRHVKGNIMRQREIFTVRSPFAVRRSQFAVPGSGFGVRGSQKSAIRNPKSEILSRTPVFFPSSGLFQMADDFELFLVQVSVNEAILRRIINGYKPEFAFLITMQNHAQSALKRARKYFSQISCAKFRSASHTFDSRRGNESPQVVGEHDHENEDDFQISVFRYMGGTASVPSHSFSLISDKWDGTEAVPPIDKLKTRSRSVWFFPCRAINHSVVLA
jgi:hypothetical protein